MKISTIIVSFNTAKLTTHAIQSVLDNYLQDDIDGEIIVVDNNSSDDSVAKIKNSYGSQVRLIVNKSNTGFAVANNQGIELSRGDFIFLLNSDTLVQPHAIKTLLYQFSTHPDNMATAQLAQTHQVDRLGMVTGQLLNSDGSLQFQGGALPSVWTLFLWSVLPIPAHWLPTSWTYHVESPSFFTKPQQMGWIGGTAMLIKREVIDEIGSLDEKIFMYAEDVEFCLRARHHHWDILYTPTAQITHHGSASSSHGNSLIKEMVSLKYVISKHFSAVPARLMIASLKIGTMLRLLLFGIIFTNAQKKNLYQEILSQL